MANPESLRRDFDKLASDALELLLARTSERADLYSSLECHHESDPTLENLWEELTTAPPWVDWDRIRRGQLVFRRYLLPIVLGFGFQGFAGEIAAAVGPAEVLIRAGGLSSENIWQRTAQTLRWLTEVTESTESIQPGGRGHISTVKVRLIHAVVRRHILEIAESRPSYFDVEQHGVPINAHDSVLTLTFFCCNPMWIQLPRLWVYPTDQEKEDFVALYRYLGHLMGVPTEYFASATQAKQTMDSLLDHKEPPNVASRKITNTFVNALVDMKPYNLSRGFVEAGVRSMNPGPVCDALGIGTPGWVPYVAFMTLQGCVGMLALLQKTSTALEIGVQTVSDTTTTSILIDMTDHFSVYQRLIGLCVRRAWQGSIVGLQIPNSHLSGPAQE